MNAKLGEDNRYHERRSVFSQTINTAFGETQVKAQVRYSLARDFAGLAWKFRERQHRPPVQAHIVSHDKVIASFTFVNKTLAETWPRISLSFGVLCSTVVLCLAILYIHFRFGTDQEHASSGL